MASLECFEEATEVFRKLSTMPESISEDDKLAVEQFVVCGSLFYMIDQVLQNKLMKPDWICLRGNRKHMK